MFGDRELAVRIKKMLSKIKQLLVRFLYPVKWKESSELRYWQERFKAESKLANDHYEFFYTHHFGFTKEFYDDKVIVDVGCGPRGSLEWANNAMRRIGVDPLADRYKELGADQHAMEYFACPAENIPLESETCDAIFSFNSLDHVENVDAVLNEINRLLKPGGVFLLLVEVNQKPTACEPHELSARGILDALQDRMDCLELAHFEPGGNQSMYDSIKANKTVEGPENCTEVGYLSAKFSKSVSK